MTSTYSKDVTCAVCGHQGKVNSMRSTNAFGSSDLDTRPPEMERSTIHMWVHACPSCGYCASDLSEPAEGLAEIVRSEPYKSIRNDVGLPAKARDFLCQALISNAQTKLNAAAWATIRAAWVCDDQGASSAATRCRLEAVDLVHCADVAGISVGEQSGLSSGIRTDLLRRAGSFAQARVVAEAAIADAPAEIVEKILRYELQLIDAQDQSCRTVAQAFEALGAQ